MSQNSENYLTHFALKTKQSGNEFDKQQRKKKLN